MQRWSRLNERQLALLSRIGVGEEPVTSDSPELALSARALKERGLIAMPRTGGKWQAGITDAGRFYLEHGHHPDLPAKKPRKVSTAKKTLDSEHPAQGVPEEQVPEARQTEMTVEAAEGEGRSTRGGSMKRAAGNSPQPAVKPARTSPAAAGPALIEEVQKAGRFLRIPNPDEGERARYRRAFDAARTCAPAGYHLKYSGRAKGDFFLGLLRVTGEDDTEWNRIRLQRSRIITDVDEVVAAVQADHSAFEVSEEVLPRVLSLIRLLAEEALARHGDMAVSKKRKQPRPLLTVHGRTYELSFRERQKQVQYVPTQHGRRKTYGWQRVTPAQRFEPSGELELHLAQQGYSYGWKEDWADTPRKPLETQIGTVFRALKTRAEEQERARLEREAEQLRLQSEREQRESERRRLEAEEQERRQREWEVAVAEARDEAAEAARAERFGTALERWRAAGEIRVFCAALEEAAARSAEPAETERLLQWSAWGKTEADRLDPTATGDGLGEEEFDAELTGDDLRPFLKGWSPYRPVKEKPPAEPAPSRPEQDPWSGLSGVPRDQGWRYGPRGRGQWWRR
ncbi:PE-PGRS family protein [Streptomyces sp. NPDC059373]